MATWNVPIFEWLPALDDGQGTLGWCLILYAGVVVVVVVVAAFCPKCFPFQTQALITFHISYHFVLFKTGLK